MKNGPGAKFVDPANMNSNETKLKEIKNGARPCARIPPNRPACYYRGDGCYGRQVM